MTVLPVLELIQGPACVRAPLDRLCKPLSEERGIRLKLHRFRTVDR